MKRNVTSEAYFNVTNHFLLMFKMSKGTFLSKSVK